MFTYEQATGRLMFRCGRSSSLVASGYAGAPGYVNDPDADTIRNRGPLPKGLYQLQIREHPRFAPPAIYLAPEPGNRMFGRAGFYIHGDNAAGNRSASSGCIILPKFARERVRTLMEWCRDLEVVSGRDVDASHARPVALTLVHNVETPFHRLLDSPPPCGAPR